MESIEELRHRRVPARGGSNLPYCTPHLSVRSWPLFCHNSHLKGPGSARAKRLQNGPFAHWPCSLSSPLALPARANYWSQLHGASGEAAQTTDMNSSAVGYTTPTSRQHAAGAAAASLIDTRGGHGAACIALCSRQALATGRSVFLDKISTFISGHRPPKYRAVDLHCIDTVSISIVVSIVPFSMVHLTPSTTRRIHIADVAPWPCGQASIIDRIADLTNHDDSISGTAQMGTLIALVSSVQQALAPQPPKDHGFSRRLHDTRT